MAPRVFIGFFALLIAALPQWAANLVTTSTQRTYSASPDGNSFRPLISDDGGRVFFFSHAPNLISNQPAPDALQLFVRNLSAGNAVLVSVTTNGQPAESPTIGTVISSNGQFVAFASDANHLAPGDTNGFRDIFVRDILSGTTRLVSVNAFGRSVADPYLWPAPPPLLPLSDNPLISADGRWIYFESRASANFTYDSALEMNSTVDIFRRDMHSNRTFLVTQNYRLLGPETADNGSTLCSITPDGQRVAFISAATDHTTTPVNNPLGDVYVRDMESNMTVLVSSSMPDYVYPTGIGHRCTNAVLSEDGRFVAFTLVPRSEPPVLYLRDLHAAAPVPIVTNEFNAPPFVPQISADGRYVLFEMSSNIFRVDILTGIRALVNLTWNGEQPTNGIARDPIMTRDGNRILFNSDSPDLTTNNASGFHVYARDMAAETTRLVTMATNGQPSTNQLLPSLIAVANDFSRAAFDSTAQDLVEADWNGASDVFVRDLASNTTALVSRREASLERVSGSAHAMIRGDSISADGRYVIFSSYDNELLPGDTNARPDVFTRDTLTATTATPGFSTDAARYPSISANGRYVLYLRRSLATPDATGGPLFRFDQQTGTNELVSATSSSAGPVISADGNLIAFISQGALWLRNMALMTNEMIAPAQPVQYRDAAFTSDSRFVLFLSATPLTTNANFSRNFYAWDRVQRTIQLVSQVDSQPVGSSGSFSLSGNSRFVAFDNQVANQIVIRDLIAQTNPFVRFNARSPALNGDGKLVAFIESLGRLFTLDTFTGEESMVADYASSHFKPLLSADGRFIIYVGRFYTGDPASGGYGFQSHLRDRRLGITTPLSPRLAGTNSNAAMWSALLAADNRTVVFHSTLSDFVPGDYNDKLDVFVLKLASPDSDGDGMDDDWEVAYFGDLLRNGHDDFDADGHTDLQEFLAGTDPTNQGSILRMLTMTPVGGGLTQIIWNAVPGRSYRVEYKNTLEATNWTVLNRTIVLNGATASTTDFSGPGTRYYRVLRLP